MGLQQAVESMVDRSFIVRVDAYVFGKIRFEKLLESSERVFLYPFDFKKNRS
jgi:hypothetical protein